MFVSTIRLACKGAGYEQGYKNTGQVDKRAVQGVKEIVFSYYYEYIYCVLLFT